MENNLKKEFTKKDVTRMRNIITGKTGDKTQTLAGWDKHNQDHKEGDIWVQDGKKWTIKNGIKQTITKLDKVKQLAFMPLTCPNCGGVLRLDDLTKKMWAIHSTCFDCVVEKEQKIKLEGKWDDYSSAIMNANKDAMVGELERALEDWMQETSSYVTEQGDVENWGGGDKKETYKQVKERIAELKKLDIYKQTED
jgi:hypothetical protein